MPRSRPVFGSDRGAGDRFDAVVGVFGLINVVRGVRPSDEPDDPTVRRIEGWTPGHDAALPEPSARPRQPPEWLVDCSCETRRMH